MSDEKIIIHNFAGIKHLEIDVKKINIFIGPQASGKSVIAKLLFYCKQLIEEVLKQGINLKHKRDLDRELINKFETYFPRNSWGSYDFSIKYFIGNESIEISNSNEEKSRNQKLKIKYSDFYIKHLARVRKIANQSPELIYSQSVLSQFKVMHDIRQRFLNDVVDQLGSVPSFWQLFIPAGRSFFATLRNSIFGFLSENNNIDPFLIEFGVYYEKLKSSHPTTRTIDIKELSQKNNSEFKRVSAVNAIKKRVLQGEYFKDRDTNIDYIQMNDGRRVQLTHCSSGQQEALPLTLILESLPFLQRGLTGRSIYIEEPEAHLFPSSQRDIVNLIATVYNFDRSRLQFVITTHSPYILTAFNNLLQAGILAQGASHERLAKITQLIPESQFIDPQEIAVYQIANGTAKSIILEDTGLINAEVIDAVSQELAIQFDGLLEID